MHTRSPACRWTIAARLLIASAAILCATLQAHALNRRIFDCGEPFSDVTCALNRFSSQYNYWFGRSEVAEARGPNPLGPPYSGSTDVDRLYNLAGQLDQYYLTKFGRNGANGIGGTGDGSNVSFLTGYTVVLANWNGSTYATQHGSCATGRGAISFSSPGYVGFCAGNTNEGLVAHEFAHIMANQYLLENLGDPSGGETGALNESLADFFGEGFERFVTGTNDWLFRNGPTNTAIRSLSDPPSIPQEGGHPSPDRYLSDDFFTGTFDDGGEHINAGVLSKASYLAVMGGSFNGFEVSGIGFNKVEQVWYRALTVYFEPEETFNQAYDDIIQAASDLYSPDDVWQITKALRAVELNMSRDFRGDLNLDGSIDALDYTVWRNGLGTEYSAALFGIWKEHYGEPPLGSGGFANIPEPSSVILLAIATLLTFLLPRRVVVSSW